MYVGNFTTSTFPSEIKEKVQLFFKESQEDREYQYKVENLDVVILLKGGSWISTPNGPSIDFAKMQIIPYNQIIDEIVRKAFDKIVDNTGQFFIQIQGVDGNMQTDMHQIEFEFYHSKEEIEKINQQIKVDREQSAQTRTMYYAVKSMCSIL